MYGGTGAEAQLPETPTFLKNDTRSTYALEVRAAPSAESLLRVLNPLQKLDVTPISVRAGEAYTATGESTFLIEILFDGSKEQADQMARHADACVLVHGVDLMRCAR